MARPWWEGMDASKLEAVGACAACGGPTDRPAWSEKQVCDRCGAPDRTQLKPFVPPKRWPEIKFHGYSQAEGKHGDAFAGEITTP